ncbi:peptide-methionine (R)-S-oxide reductase [Aeromonas sp. RU39B]|mgnify:CR=1 FL=1|jgi:peptide-methionine (R)-S-oxide reductase|uniref:peptide-methionine (R)-S-oxide reductase MsrB n=1 Tax=Aeromonas sp. RU39B TaxID=1907416 RepID=UPI000955EA12|nr:peptide-methionine (R)-S-oxide reductase MsrB [Aeromonas sp. RU39B]SIQ35029.1 peptide-methionine (R)-S-oxide reductase [Aeromonas sp. RU39B]
MHKNDPTQWRERLTPEQFHVCWEKGTERPYTGALLHNRKQGQYLCVCCKSVLFDASAKFDSGCGWPSFDQAIAGTVDYTRDTSHGMERVEITCHTCGSHLGHVFPDGPTETGQRYCVNSLSLDFASESAGDAQGE